MVAESATHKLKNLSGFRDESGLRGAPVLVFDEVVLGKRPWPLKFCRKAARVLAFGVVML